MSHLTLLAAEMIIVMQTQINIWSKVLGYSKNHVGEQLDVN